VIEVEFLTRESPATVLADALVPGVDIIPAKADVALGHPVITYQQNDPRNADNAVHQTYRFIVGGNG
jgi:hypothetical protein